MPKPNILVVTGYSVPKTSHEPLLRAFDERYKVKDLCSLSLREALEYPDKVRSMARGAIIVTQSAGPLGVREAHLEEYTRAVQPLGMLSFDGVEPQDVLRLMAGAQRIKEREAAIMADPTLDDEIRERIKEQGAAAVREVASHPVFHAKVLRVIAKTSSTMELVRQRAAHPDMPAFGVWMRHGEFRFTPSRPSIYAGALVGVRFDVAGTNPLRDTHNSLLWDPHAALGQLPLEAEVGLRRRK